MALHALLVYNNALNNKRFQAEMTNFVQAFKKHKIKLEPVSNTKVFRLVESNPRKYDFAVFWDKDTFVSRYLEDTAKIPVFNSTAAIETTNDKGLMYLALRNYRVKIPETVILPYNFNLNLLNNFPEIQTMLKNLDYPFLVKERFSTSTSTVSFISSEVNFKYFLEKNGMKSLLVQEYIEPIKRHLYRFFVIGGQVIAGVEIISFKDKDQNIREKYVRLSVKRKFRKLAASASSAVNADFAAVDILFQAPSAAYVISVKTNAFFMAAEQVTGLYLSWYVARFIKHVYQDRLI